MDQSKHQSKQRRFTFSGGPDNGHNLSWAGFEGSIHAKGMILIIGERNSIHLYFESLPFIFGKIIADGKMYFFPQFCQFADSVGGDGAVHKSRNDPGQIVECR